MIKARKHNFFYAVLAFILTLCTLFTSFVNMCVAYAYADDGVHFDNTDVLGDLRSSNVDGKPFDLNEYPFDSTGLIKSPKIINFVEYCYSFKVNMQDNYGLYVYFYNPQALELDTGNKGNKIQVKKKKNLFIY